MNIKYLCSLSRRRALFEIFKEIFCIGTLFYLNLRVKMFNYIGIVWSIGINALLIALIVKYFYKSVYFSLERIFMGCSDRVSYDDLENEVFEEFRAGHNIVYYSKNFIFANYCLIEKSNIADGYCSHNKNRVECYMRTKNNKSIRIFKFYLLNSLDIDKIRAEFMKEAKIENICKH